MVLVGVAWNLICIKSELTDFLEKVFLDQSHSYRGNCNTAGMSAEVLLCGIPTLIYKEVMEKQLQLWEQIPILLKWLKQWVAVDEMLYYVTLNMMNGCGRDQSAGMWITWLMDIGNTNLFFYVSEGVPFAKDQTPLCRNPGYCPV